ncbi:MAG: hypothetical protein IKR11_05795 [Solobacterium sp.]|nr:hypothetical protein [Solobacterium sp.]
MNKWVYKLQRFMMGRNGMDYLSLFLWILSVLLTFIHMFIRKNILIYIGDVFLLISIFRILSKNIYKRQQENRIFLQIISPLTNRINDMQKQKKDPDHRYYRCPKCHQLVRVPKGRGRIEITCPRCKNIFEKRS